MSQRSRSLTIAQISVLVVATGFTFNFLARGIADSFVVFILPLEQEFGWSHSSLTGVYSIYLLTAGLSAPLYGRAFDRFGPLWVYVNGLALLAAGLFAASFTYQHWHIYLSVGIAGGVASSALGMVTASALIARWHDRRMGTAVAIAYAGFGSGMLLLVPLSQLLVDSFGWRGAYRALALGVALLLPVLLMLPWQQMSAQKPGDPQITDPILSGRGGAALWSPMSAIHTREFWLLVMVFFFTAAAMYSVIVQTVPYLVSEGLAPLRAASAFGFAGMLSIVGMLCAGWLSDRYGFRIVATLSFLGTLLGSMALLAVSFYPGLLMVTLYILFFGISQGARGPIVSTLTNRLFHHGHAASIFGLVYMSMSLGAATGSFTSGLLHDMTGNYRAAFGFSAACILFAVAPFWLSQRLVKPSRLPPPEMQRPARTARR